MNYYRRRSIVPFVAFIEQVQQPMPSELFVDGPFVARELVDCTEKFLFVRRLASEKYARLKQD